MVPSDVSRVFLIRPRGRSADEEIRQEPVPPNDAAIAAPAAPASTAVAAAS